jgi:hypothetical protein
MRRWLDPTDGTPPMKRRHLLAASLLPTALTTSGCGVAPVQGFATLADARRAIAGLGPPSRSRGTWRVAPTLVHLAQSIEYSIDGFPQMKPAWFTSSVGPLAFAWFESRGAMSHALDEPIPGAPVLDPAVALDAARERLLAALVRFDAHRGTIAPHFAYGPLDKDEATRAHLMHIANHWTEFEPGPPPETKTPP